ncbi:hypothetical protein BTN33_22765 [Aeromonas veronii]|uniref:trypsin-like serine protease n=1 Tax=Aeromonas veronii TaxID=654 RepID=UPI000946A568|nr:trypsin-like serine protease [Aeromonas veronii]OLF56812.1 hypothetical protein BTN33_22765 [Aeromonas veronii]
MNKTIISFAVASVISCSAFASTPSDEEAYKAYMAYKAQLDAEQDAIVNASLQELESLATTPSVDEMAAPSIQVQPKFYQAVLGSHNEQVIESSDSEVNNSLPTAKGAKGSYPSHSLSAAPVYDGALAYADNCVGSVIAGKFVISAGHCGDQTGKIISIKSLDGTIKTIRVNQTIHHPLYDAMMARVYDVAIWKLDGAGDQTKYISTSSPAIGSLFDGLSMKGGEYRSYRVRATGPADSRFSPDGYEGLYSPTDAETTGHSVPGDSGGSCVGADGLLWGVIQGSAGQGDGTYIQSCQDLTNPNTSQWLLETINEWSAPTFVKGDGALTVKIQNLHTGAEFLNPVAEGVTIESSTCNGPVQPFGNCQIVVRGTGKVILSAGQEIKVNEVVPPTPDQGGNGDNGGGGGGSTGPFALLGIAVATLIRRFKF